MKLKFIYLFFILFITKAYSQEYVYQQEFTTQGTWTKGNNDVRNLYVANGKYYFQHKKTEGNREITTRTFTIDFSRDFEIETSITKISGVDNSGISFLYDYKDEENYAEFGYASNGYYRVATEKNDTYNSDKSWTKSSTVKTGNYNTNKLKIKKTGSKLNFYINDTYVYSKTFSSFIGNRLGVRLYKNQKVAIDYFRIKYAKSKSVISTNTNSKTILFEGFNNNKNSWPENNGSVGMTDVVNGDYLVEHKSSTGGWSATIDKYINTNRDFRITAQIKKLSGVDNNGFGIVFGKKDLDNQNQFFISANGSYIINKTVNGKRTYVKEWTNSSHIKTGNRKYNYLKIEKKGSKYNFYINSKLVHTSYYTKLYGNKVGFIVYDKIKISVGYLSMMYTDNKTNTNTTITKNSHITKESILFDGYTSNINDWALSNNNNATLEIKNGNYDFAHNRDKGGWSSTISKYINTDRDFKILADIKKISGIQNNGYGIIFGREDSSNQNLFYINGNGSYSIKRVKNGSDNYLKNWTSSSSIRKGNGAYNVLKVVKNGKNLEYYINNTKVYTDYSPEFFGDRLGYIIYNKQKISIAYLSVGYLDKKTTINNNFNTTDNITTFNYSDSGYHFSEQYTSNNNSWFEKSDTNIDFKINKGKYYLKHKRTEKGWSTYIDKDIDTSKDFEIETKIDKISGVTNYGYGLIYGRKNDDDFRFYISSSGYYKIVRVVNNKEQIIQKWTTTSHVKTGNQKSNVLKLVKEGSNAKFYINNHFVHSTDFEQFYGNKIGYVVYNNQEIAIDYLRVKYKENNTNVIASKVLKVPFIDNFDSNKSAWQIENSEDYSANITSGKLQLNKKKKGGIFISNAFELDDSKDFIIETSLAKTATSDEGLYGITFGRKNSSNEFTFLLYSNGGYSFRKFDNDVYKKIIPYTAAKSMKTGLNQFNKIKIVKSGGLLRFYINNKYVNETPFEPFFGNKIGYTIYYDKKIAVDYLDIKYQSSNFNNPPTVVITEPYVETSRGFKIVEAKKVLVKGKATDADGIYEITVNGVEASVTEDGTFIANVPLKYGKNDLIVKATDIKQASSTKTFTIKRKSADINNTIITTVDETEKLDIGFGKYYALIIGVSDYTDKTIEGLKGEPTKDAQDLADVLVNNYNFDDENVTILKSPTENEIIKEFYNLKKKVGKNDNVLIFYAGHGNYDEVSEKGYWMPSDTNMEFEGNVILNTSVVSYIKSINSKHTLLISDACFSGSILKTDRSYKTASKAVQKKYSLPSRRAITSGTLTTVPNKSVFMKYLLKRLTQNQSQYLSARQLFNMIEDPVINNTTGDNQPQYAPISNTGDEGGDFIFIKK